MNNVKQEKKDKKKSDKWFVVAIVLIVVLVFIVLLFVMIGNEHGTKVGLSDSDVTIEMPWKNNTEYTWEEFEKLSDEKKEVFYESFGSADEFEKWMNSAKSEPNRDNTEVPWEDGGKKPSKYTWEEFCDLNEIQQELFFEWFKSPDDFEKWYHKVK